MGAGIFVSTGTAARSSGPSVVIAYLVAGISALLSALCYTEFAVEMPVAGGAFSYLRITFGRLLPDLFPRSDIYIYIYILALTVPCLILLRPLSSFPVIQDLLFLSVFVIDG